MWPCLNLPWLRSPVWFISASLAIGCSPCVDKRQRHHLRLRWAWSARNSQVCGERMTPVARSSIISVDWQPRELAVCLFYWNHEQLFLSDPGLNFQGNLETLHWDRKAILESGIQLWNSVFKDMFVHFSPPPPKCQMFSQSQRRQGSSGQPNISLPLSSPHAIFHSQHQWLRAKTIFFHSQLELPATTL